MKYLNSFNPLKWEYEERVNAFFFFDIIFLFAGLSSIGIGIWLYIDRNTFIELTPTSYSAFSAAGLCCFTGATISIISIVGIISIWLRNTLLLKTFIGFVFLLGVLQAFTGIVGLVHKEGASEYVRNDLLRNINNTVVYSSAGRKMELSYSWGQLQGTLKCCGVDGPEDWYFSVYFPNNEFVLDSCCDASYFADRDAMVNCGTMKKEEAHVYERGCYRVFVNWLFHHIRVVNFLSACLIFIEIFTLTAAIYTLLELRQSEEKLRRSREQERRNRLIAINERESRDLQLTPLDRVGDANWAENEERVPEDP